MAIPIGPRQNEPPTKRGMEANRILIGWEAGQWETISVSHWSGTEIGGTNDDRVDVCDGSNARPFRASTAGSDVMAGRAEKVTIPVVMPLVY